MSEQQGNAPGANDVKEYAGGWMAERKGTDAPAFLKFAFPLIGFFAVAYLIVYMNGEVSHSDRGEIVKRFNEATQSSPMLMYVVAGMALVYVVMVVLFAMGKPHKED
jgi:hypothetical protein